MGFSGSGDVRAEEREVTRQDIRGKTLHASNGYLIFVQNNTPHYVDVTARGDTIKIGCVSLTKEAWKLLKLRIDGGERLT